MKKNNGKDPNTSNLRRCAEKKLEEKQAKTRIQPKSQDTLKLIHELQVHQIELEMQNEELMEARAKIEESYEKYSDLYDFAPVGYFTITDDGIIREANLAGAVLLRKERSRLINRHFDFFISDETQSAFFAFLRKVLGGNTREKCEVVLSRNKDKARHIHIEGRAWDADKSMDRQCLMAVQDITEQKAVEEELRKHREDLEKIVKERTAELKERNISLEDEITRRKHSEDALQESIIEVQDLYNNAPCGYHTLDKDSYFVRINDTELKWLGYSREEMIGKLKFTDVLTEASKQISRQRFPRFKEGGWISELELEMVRKDGTIMPILLNATAIKDNSGNIEKSRSTLFDITESIRSEEEKKRIETQLVHAQQMEALGNLAAGIAHDFNNIIQPILINSEIISDTLLPGTQEREYLDQIIEAAQLGKNMIRQIKAFGSGKKVLFNPVSLGPIVHNALKFFKRSLPPDIKFRKRITAKECLVKIDPTQVHQLILNLCTNAAQAMNSGKGSLAVFLNETEITSVTPAIVIDLKPGRYVKLTVSDTGCGIRPETQDKIFAPFFTTRKTSMGTGLGLAVVYEVIKNAQGSILLHSEVGKGTRFEVYFPLDFLK